MANITVSGAIGYRATADVCDLSTDVTVGGSIAYTVAVKAKERNNLATTGAIGYVGEISEAHSKTSVLGVIGYSASVDLCTKKDLAVSGAIGYAISAEAVVRKTISVSGSIAYGGMAEASIGKSVEISSSIGYKGSCEMLEAKDIVMAGRIM